MMSRSKYFKNLNSLIYNPTRCTPYALVDFRHDFKTVSVISIVSDLWNTNKIIRHKIISITLKNLKFLKSHNAVMTNYGLNKDQREVFAHRILTVTLYILIAFHSNSDKILGLPWNHTWNVSCNTKKTSRKASGTVCERSEISNRNTHFSPQHNGFL